MSGSKKDQRLKYKAYIFDLYGTLVDIHTDERMPRLWRSMEGWYSERGAVYTAPELQAAWHEEIASETLRVKGLWEERGAEVSCPEPDIVKVFRRLYTMKGVSPDSETVTQTARIFRELSTTHIRLYAGARELLAAISRRGGRVYLLSNAQSAFTLPELEQLGIRDDFDAIYISSDCAVKKPDERFYRRLLDDTGLQPSDCLMIGNDLDCDIRGASDVGMDCYYIFSGLSPRSDRMRICEGCPAVGVQYGMDLRKTLRTILKL